MRVRRTALGGLVVVALAAVLLALLSAPSQADPKKLLVSNTATGPFRDNLATPLFDGAGRFVPLDEASSTFYVKNNSKQTARATLAVVNRGGSNDFEDALTFDVDIDGTAASGAVPEVGSKGCSLITTGPSIAPGKVQAVDISLAVADLQDQVGMDQAATLDFVLTLTQTGKNGQVEVCGEQATAQPEVKGAQGGRSDCRRDVVVTVAGDPTCVPTAVDAGRAGHPSYGAGDPRSALAVTGMAGLLAGLGAGLVLWANRRRRTTD
jgi:hypothetical protein